MIETGVFKVGKERYPFFCQWELTCRCNLRCVMCYTDCFNTAEKVRQELSTPEIFRIMDELKEAGCSELCLTGGEPLARPDFFEIYEHAIRSGFLVTVFTNATLVTEAIADRFAALPPSRIEISMHGATAGVFDQVTQGEGSFQKCMRAIDLLNERQIPVVLKTVAMTLNQTEVLAIKQFAASRPRTAYKLNIYMQPTLEGSRAPSQYQMEDSAVDRMFESDPDLTSEVKDSRCGVGGCAGGKLKFHIDAYGQLQLCSGNRRKSYDLRSGSFEEGFYKHLPDFPCPNKRSLAAGDVIAGPERAKQSPRGCLD